MKFFLLLAASIQFVFASSYSEIKVSTINMWGIPGQRKMVFARCEALGKEINKQEHNMVFVQEAFTSGMRGTIKANSGDSYRGLFIYPRTLKLSHGLYNLSQYKVTKASFMPFRSCGGVQCLAKKGVLYMQIELNNGKRVDTFNTHLQAFWENSKIRAQQLKTLKRFINSINKGDLPVVLAGDFNISADGSEYQYLTETLSDFTDTYKDSNPNLDGDTWVPSENYWINGGSSQRIDYIFVRDGKKDHWEVVDSFVDFNTELPWNLPDKERSNYIYVSDHFGVTSKLHLSHAAEEVEPIAPEIATSLP